MRELSVMEVEAVSGAGFWDAISSSLLAAAGFGSAGAIIGGMHGGDGGGILGVGTIGQGVGMVAGGLMGVAAGLVGGFIVGWNDPNVVTSLVTQLASQISNNLFS
ncbi:colicin V synthesis protein [Raoultella sp. T31]|uniref:colicin V synthesis protein n=1 Tax=Raoultella sp. T31 TaxID=2054594 RepID=UPI000C2821A3|nr:colicin V synthesis protein [Raoultella sp. T31]